MKPKPIHTETVCSVCGLDWDRHTTQTVKECVELLKADLAREKQRTAPQPIPMPYPVPYPVSPYRPVQPWIQPRPYIQPGRIWMGNSSAGQGLTFTSNSANITQ